MANFRRRKRTPKGPFQITVSSLSHDGRGVCHPEGKATFLHGALPNETVNYMRTRVHKDYDEGEVVDVVTESRHRVKPACDFYHACGGCSLQHMQGAQQIIEKQHILLGNLQRIGHVEPETVLPPLCGPHWGYRRKARLGVKHVPKKGRVLVGFRERQTPFVTDMSSCEVLDPRVGHKLTALSEMIGELSIAARLPQIEVAISDEEVALVFRVLEPPNTEDLKVLSRFGVNHAMQIYLQPKGPDTIYPLEEGYMPLTYKLPAHDVSITFLPSDFTQVNAEINEQMIDRALELLDCQPEHTVLDLFCGLGNFTLPLARRVASVTGVEGDTELVCRAENNAAANQLSNTNFFVHNLYELTEKPDWANKKYDRILLDPPRSGASEVLSWVAATGAERIVYVSCNPATLARDAGQLVNQHGYRLDSAGVMDMFPQTGHVESIALFVKPKK